MSMWVSTDDNRVFSAECPTHLVSQLRKFSLVPAENNAEWMAASADRIQELTGCRIDASSPRNFILGLEQTGLIHRLPDDFTIPQTKD